MIRILSLILILVAAPVAAEMRVPMIAAPEVLSHNPTRTSDRAALPEMVLVEGPGPYGVWTTLTLSIEMMRNGRCMALRLRL